MHGRWFCSAISCARRCFFTVSGKYVPPLTVASLATITHSSPSTTPIPVTIPAPGACPSYRSHAASVLSSRKAESGSTSRSIRSRASSFPRERCRSTAFGPPPAVTCAGRSRSSATRASMRSARSAKISESRSTCELKTAIAVIVSGPERRVIVIARAPEREPQRLLRAAGELGAQEPRRPRVQTVGVEEDAAGIRLEHTDPLPTAAGRALNFHASVLPARNPAPHIDLRPSLVRDEWEAEGRQGRLGARGREAFSLEVQTRLIRGSLQRLVAELEPREEADTGLPRPVQGLRHPAGLESDGHAERVGRPRVPAELRHPQARRAVRPDVTRADGSPEQLTRFGKVAERGSIVAVGAVHRPARGIGMDGPDVEADPRAARGVRMLPARDTEGCAHELERSRARRSVQRGEQAGHDDVVTVNTPDRSGKGVHHLAVPDRAYEPSSLVLRREVLGEVRLVEGKPAADARETVERPAVSPRCGPRE